MIHSWDMDLFEQMPWAKTLFAWLVSATAVILFLSIPSYLILAPLARAVRDAVNRFAAHLTETHRANAAARKQLLAEAVDQYATDHLLIHLVTTAKTYWGKTMSDAIQTATQVRKAIQSAEQSVRELADSVPMIHRSLATLDTSFPKDLAAPGNIPALQIDTYKLRVARMELCVSLLLVAAVASVNTGILSEILGGLIPRSLSIAGVSLYIVFAFVITIVESSLGFLHGSFSSQPDSNATKLSLGGLFMISLTLFIGLVEGFFYSRIHQNRADTFTIPLMNYTMPQTDVYFIWGTALVMILSSFGLLIHRSWRGVLRETSTACVRKELSRMRSEIDRWSVAVRGALDLATKAHEQTTSGPGLAPGAANVASNAVQQLIDELAGLQDPPWTKSVEVRLGKTEIISLSHQATLWSSLFLLAGVIVTVCSASALLQVGSFTALSTATLVGAAQAILLAIAGFVSANNEIVFDAKRNSKILAPTWSRTLGLVLLGVVTIINLLILFIVAVRAGTGLVWLSNMLAGLGLFAAAYQLCPLLSLAAFNVRHLLSLLAGCWAACARGFVRCLGAFALVADLVFSGLASPLTRIFGRKDLPDSRLSEIASRNL